MTGVPKNYAYTVIDTVTGQAATVCKFRGITLNYNAKQLVNFDVIMAVILGTGEPTVTVHTEKKIKRKRNGGGTVAIVIEPEDKMYRISFFQRRRLGDNSTVSARPSMSDDLKFWLPFSCIVSGPSGSRKSSFVIRFLQNLDYLCTEPTFPGGIVWCYGEKSAVPSRHQLPANVRYNEGVP